MTVSKLFETFDMSINAIIRYVFLHTEFHKRSNAIMVAIGS